MTIFLTLDDAKIKAHKTNSSKVVVCGVGLGQRVGFQGHRGSILWAM